MSNKFIIADPDRCIACGTCMAACIMKHDTDADVAEPRLNVVVASATTAPVACHHCVDAPCAAACPTGALFQDKDNQRVAIDESKCIGCRSCVMACPFGAVSVTTKEVPVKMGDLLIGERQKAMVVKCDLCVDRPGGPACVEACPTAGLRVVEQDTLTESVRARQVKAAEATETMAHAAV